MTVNSLNIIRWSLIIALSYGAWGCVQAEQERGSTGAPQGWSVVQNEDGSATVFFGDDTKLTLLEDSPCTITENSDTNEAVFSCTDGSSITLKTDSSCTVHEDDHTQVVTIACSDGSSLTFSRPKDGLSSLVRQDDATSAECSDGGVVIHAGLDSNADGVLQDEEIQSSTIVCHGAPGPQGERGVDGSTGPSGEDGAEMMATVTVLSTSHVACPNGGYRIHIGTKGDDGELDQSKDIESVTICHGEAGEQGEKGEDARALAVAHTDLALDDDRCTNGGIFVQISPADDDGKFDADEELTSFVICHGQDGAEGLAGADGQDGAPGENASCFGRTPLDIQNIEVEYDWRYTVGESYTVSVDLSGLASNATVTFNIVGMGASFSPLTEVSQGTYETQMKPMNAGGPFQFAIIAQDGCTLDTHTFDVRKFKNPSIACYADIQQQAIYIDTEEDLFLYRDCTDIHADLYIGPNVDIASLPNLERVFGFITVEESFYLEELYLPELYYVEADLKIAANASQFRVLDVPQLHKIDGNLGVWLNSGIAALDFPNLLHVYGSVNIDDNSNLEQINFPVLKEVANGVLSLTALPLLTSFNAAALEQISNGIWFWGCDSLESFSLPALETVGGPVGVENNALMTQFSFPALTFIAGDSDMSFGVRDNPALESFNMPLLSVLDVGPLYIGENDVLNTFDLSSLDEVRGNGFIIRNNVQYPECWAWDLYDSLTVGPPMMDIQISGNGWPVDICGPAP